MTYVLFARPTKTAPLEFIINDDFDTVIDYKGIYIDFGWFDCTIREVTNTITCKPNWWRTLTPSKFNLK